MKLGKKPARPGSVKLSFTKYLTTLPVVPSKYGFYSAVKDWQGMLGNDEYGDCVWAGGDHEHIYWNEESENSVSFTEKTALADYSACTGFNPKDPNSDQGTDVQVSASYRLKTGLLDSSGKRHKIGAYVSLTAGNIEQLKLAIYLFGAVGVGINFPASAMTQFNAGKNWTVSSKSSIEGGHYIPVVGYDSRYFYLVTWGKLIKMSYGFYKKYNDETVCYLDEEMMTNGVSPAGYDVAALQADQKAIQSS